MTTRDGNAALFYIDDHALLYARLAESADILYRQAGLDAIELAIIAYAKERSLRSAMRCLADGLELDGKNYFLYAELRDPQGWNKAHPLDIQPAYRTHTTVCGWADTWAKHGLAEYGKLYCKWIDKCLAQGFSPDLQLEMDKFLTSGDQACEFVWPDCRFADDTELAALMNKKAQMAPRVTKDFLFHCGHLYATFRRELYLALGLTAGQKILDLALAAYAKDFSPEKAALILEEAKLDFLTV